MYSVSVRDHFMIAHSFTGDVFGPAQRLHGATYVVDVEFRRGELDADGIVVDIGRAIEAVRAVLGGSQLSRTSTRARVHRPQHDDRVSRARCIFDRHRRPPFAGDLGAQARGIESVRVTLHESHMAWAAFEGPASAKS